MAFWGVVAKRRLVFGSSHVVDRVKSWRFFALLGFRGETSGLSRCLVLHAARVWLRNFFAVAARDAHCGSERYDRRAGLAEFVLGYGELFEPIKPVIRAPQS
jgi:hypothetical protein